jgi:hypothetical protein
MQDIKIKVNFLSQFSFSSFLNFKFSKIIEKLSPHLDSGFSLVALFCTSLLNYLDMFQKPVII